MSVSMSISIYVHVCMYACVCVCGFTALWLSPLSCSTVLPIVLNDNYVLEMPLPPKLDTILDSSLLSHSSYSTPEQFPSPNFKLCS